MWSLYRVVCHQGAATSFTIEVEIWATSVRAAFDLARRFDANLTPFAIR